MTILTEQYVLYYTRSMEYTAIVVCPGLQIENHVAVPLVLVLVDF